jgi:hypothetical protein
VKTETGPRFLLHNIISEEDTFDRGWHRYCNVSSWRTLMMSTAKRLTIIMTNGDTSCGFTQSSTWRSGLSISDLVLRLSKIHQTLWPTFKFIAKPRCFWGRSPEPHYVEPVVCSCEGGWGKRCWPFKLKKSECNVHQTTLYIKSSHSLY